MITLQNDQDLFESSEFRVLQGGDFDENELVEVYRKDDPEKRSLCAYAAGYIFYGNAFYNTERPA